MYLLYVCRPACANQTAVNLRGQAGKSLSLSLGIDRKGPFHATGPQPLRVLRHFQRMVFVLKRRQLVVSLLSTLMLAACGQTVGGGAGRLGPDGKPLPQVLRLSPADEGRLQLRMLDSVNALRQARGQAPVQLSAELNAAAATHARDMSVQNRPWHFGSDGSSPLQRAQRVGYRGQVLGELISETYENETETLAAWMADADTRNVLMQADVREIGFSFFQENSGKIWWCLVTGAGAAFGAV